MTVSPDTAVPATDTYPGHASDLGPGVPFHRLARVELRKMVDTRAGLWMLVTMGLFCVLVVTAVPIWGNDADFGF